MKIETVACDACPTLAPAAPGGIAPDGWYTLHEPRVPARHFCSEACWRRWCARVVVVEAAAVPGDGHPARIG